MEKINKINKMKEINDKLHANPHKSNQKVTKNKFKIIESEEENSETDYYMEFYENKNEKQPNLKSAETKSFKTLNKIKSPSKSIDYINLNINEKNQRNLGLLKSINSK